MNRARKVIGREFAFFPHVDEQKLFAPVDFRFHIIDGHFVNALPGVFDDLQKTRGMLMSHGSSIRSIYFSGGIFWRDAATGLLGGKPGCSPLQREQSRLRRSEAGVANPLADY